MEWGGWAPGEGLRDAACSKEDLQARPGACAQQALYWAERSDLVSCNKEPDHSRAQEQAGRLRRRGADELHPALGTSQGGLLGQAPLQAGTPTTSTLEAGRTQPDIQTGEGLLPESPQGFIKGGGKKQVSIIPVDREGWRVLRGYVIDHTTGW